MKDNFLKLIDSNVLVYAFDESEEKKHLIAKDLLIKCFTGKNEICY